MDDARYRKINDLSLNSSKYHKLDGTPVRAHLKIEARKEIEEETASARPAALKSRKEIYAEQ